MNNFLIKITILTLFVFYPSISSASGNGETFRQLELFGDIFEKVRKFYVEDTNDGYGFLSSTVHLPSVWTEQWMSPEEPIVKIEVFNKIASL